MPLITEPLSTALAVLRKHYDLSTSPIAVQHPELISTFHTATIKSFEYAYELSVKLLRRALEEASSVPGEIDQMDFRALIRTAAERGLIADPESWFLFRESRNITAHTYDERKARDVLAVMPSFIEKAAQLLAMLQRDTHASA